MDVVPTNVERIGGKVELDSRPARGTTLRLSIPLTLAIIPALIVRSRGQNFALPQGALFELVHLTAAQAREQIEWLENASLCPAARAAATAGVSRPAARPARGRG